MKHADRKMTIAAVALLVSGTLIACQVPVFRYALERWGADDYRVIVLHDGDLSAAQSESLALLKKRAEKKTENATSVLVTTINVATQSKAMTPEQLAAWAKHSDRSTPLMLVHYPAANKVSHKAPVSSRELTKESVSELFDSPVRRQLAQNLSKGDSAVWLFVPCGRREADDAALARLKKQLAADSDWLEVPSADELEVKPEVLENVKIPLKMQFSTLTVRRDDPAERFLLESLLKSEDDLLDFDEPLAFPVFGQGRVLYALVGKGINSATVRSASQFIGGPCSCQVKNQNPGFDLLLNHNWKKAVGEVLISEPIETVDAEANAPRLLTIPPGRKSRK